MSLHNKYNNVAEFYNRVLKLLQICSENIVELRKLYLRERYRNVHYRSNTIYGRMSICSVTDTKTNIRYCLGYHYVIFNS